MKVTYRNSALCFLFVFNLFFARGLFAASNKIIRSRKVEKNTYQQQDLGNHIIYTSPLPGSEYITTVSNIIIRSDNLIDQSTIDNNLFIVTGSLSGKHDGKIILVDDGKTILFQPDNPFYNGETVNFSLNKGLKTISGADISLIPLTFTISNSNLNSNNKLSFNDEFSSPDPSQAKLNSVTPIFTGNNPKKIENIKIDSADFPPDLPFLTVDTSNNPTKGYLFLSSMNGISARSLGNYNMIVDNDATPLYYGKVGVQYGTDFKIQPNGTLSYFDENTIQYYIMNTSLQIIDSVKCGNGYITDVHELRILPDGHMFLLGDDYERVDMNKIVNNGYPAAKVMGIILQELDKNKNVIFQWRSWDHYQITDATHENLSAPSIDYVHANAIEIATDGNILLSARHLDEITKINILNGDTIWRFGGKNNQFTFVNDSIRFSHQHSIRQLPNGNLIFFDNGNYHTPSFSRAVEYKLDENNKVATLVWQYRHNPDVYGSAMGYVQRLSNGNTLIGWGQASTALTEVTPEGNTALDMYLPYDDWNYRVFRFPFIFIKSPLKGQLIKAKSKAVIKWNSSGVDSVNIDYSTDGGNSWKNIVTNYPGDVDSLNWNTPALTSPYCKIRITESGVMDPGNIFYSDSLFGISIAPEKSAVGGPFTYNLFNNYPNPFNPSTYIRYSLAADSKVSIKVYNALGQFIKEIVNANRYTGEQEVKFYGGNLPSGVYFYTITAVSLDGKKEFSMAQKMVLLK